MAMQATTLLLALWGAYTQPLPSDLDRFPSRATAELGLQRAEGHLVWIEAMRHSGYPQMTADLDTWEVATRRQAEAWQELSYAHWGGDNSSDLDSMCQHLDAVRRLIGEDAWHAGRMPGICPQWNWRGPLAPLPWPWVNWP